MKVKKIDFSGTSIIGLYAFATDSYVLLGSEIHDKYVKELEQVLKVPVHKITIAGTSLLGVFLAGDNEKLIVPDIIFEREENKLKEIGMEYVKVKTLHTCLGNNFFIGKKTILANPEIEESVLDQVAKYYDKKTQKVEIAETNTIGSLLTANNDLNKVLITNDLNDEEAEEIAKIIGMEVTTGSINRGSPHIKSGVICNKNGILIGSNTGGPELVNTTKALYDE